MEISISLLLSLSLLLSQHDIVVAQSNNLDPFNTPPVPITSDSPDRTIPSLADFVESLEYDGQLHIIGVYVPGILAMRVVQQPPNELAFVSNLPNVLTQFKLASDYGSYGFLAHNYLAGATFFEFEIGQSVFSVDGNGQIRSYIVSELLSVQAISPQSPNSQFRYLDFRGSYISNLDLFNEIYAEEDRVILQTCISSQEQPYWGRYFVIAIPSDKLDQSVDKYTKFIDEPFN